jgi:hypothetical protein
MNVFIYLFKEIFTVKLFLNSKTFLTNKYIFGRVRRSEGGPCWG